MSEQRLKLDPTLIQKVRKHHKSITIRAGVWLIEPGPLVFESSDGSGEEVGVWVTQTVIKRFGDLGYVERELGDHRTEVEMALSLLEFYPDLAPDSTVTVVHFLAPYGAEKLVNMPNGYAVPTYE